MCYTQKKRFRKQLLCKYINPLQSVLHQKYIVKKKTRSTPSPKIHSHRLSFHLRLLSSFLMKGAKWILTESAFLTKASNTARRVGFDVRDQVILFERKPGWLSFDMLSKQTCKCVMYQCSRFRLLLHSSNGRGVHGRSVTFLFLSLFI